MKLKIQVSVISDLEYFWTKSQINLELSQTESQTWNLLLFSESEKFAKSE